MNTYEDERLTQVEEQKNEALTEMEQTYQGMAQEAGKFYDQQIEASKQWADTQTQLQQEQTDFAIEQVQQQKEQAQKDYLKEQSAAYKDWQKQSAQHGVNAEAVAAQGMTATGFSESSQVAMYTAYQNRVATARETFNRAVQAYENDMTQARLQGSAAMAEIALNAFQKQLELGLQGFQYQNQILLDLTSKKLEVDNMYNNRYLAMLDQINTERSMAEQIRQYNESLAEQIRQYNESMAEDKRQYDESMAFQREQYEYQKAMDAASGSGGGGYYSSGSPDYVLDEGDTQPEREKKPGGELNKKVVTTDNRAELGLGDRTDQQMVALVAGGKLDAKTDGKKVTFSYSNKTKKELDLLAKRGY